MRKGTAQTAGHVIEKVGDSCVAPIATAVCSDLLLSLNMHSQPLGKETEANVTKELIGSEQPRSKGLS